MYLFKAEERFDQKTGKSVGTVLVVAGVICDYTGEFSESSEDFGPEYHKDYMSLDPNCGCGVGENEFADKYDVDVHDFLLGSPYIFDDDNVDVIEVLDTAVKEGFDRPGFDQLFRWCRIRTADRLLTEGKYTKEELGLHKEN